MRTLLTISLLLIAAQLKGADLSLHYERSSLQGAYNDFMDNYSTQRVGGKLGIPLSRSVSLSIEGGQEQLKYTYFYGTYFLNQVMTLYDGTIIGATGAPVYYRKRESLVGPYFSMELKISI